MTRGIFYNQSARIIFIVSSYVLHIGLARLLDKHNYGLFGVLLSILMISRVFLENGVKQSITRLTATYPKSAIPILFSGLKLQIIIGILIAAVLALLNSTIVHFFNEPALRIPLYVATFIVAIQGIFYVFGGILNGLCLFLRDSVMISIYFIARPVLALAIVYFGFKINGVMVGLAGACFISIMVGGYFCRNLSRESIDLSRESIFKIAWPILVFFGFVTLIMNLDLLAVKHYMVNDKDITGVYTAVGCLSKPGYWLLISFGVVGLPLIATEFAKGNSIGICKNIKCMVTYSVCLVAPAIVILRAMGPQLIEALYTKEYLAAVQPFRILIIGIFFLGLSTIFANCLIAINLAGRMVLVAIGAGCLCITLNAFLVPKYGMMGAAVSTTMTSFCLSMVLGTLVLLSVGNFIKLFSFFKWIGVIGAIWFLSGYITGGIVSVVIYSLILYVAACFSFIMLKEFNLEGLLQSFDKRRVRNSLVS